MVVDVWGDLLRGARSRHAFVSKTIVVLGEPSSGKSTLVQQLAGARGTTVPRETTGPLRFGYMGDDRSLSDETLRTGVYTVHSSDPSVVATLPYAFPPVQTAPDASALGSLRRMRDTLFVLVLDWSRPWSFAAQLVAWLHMLCRLVESAHPAGCEHDAETERADMKQHLASMLSCEAVDNLGVPLVIVCTKADAIDTALRERYLRDDQFDFLQQLLRTVALRFGAAVFSTTINRAASFDALRSFVTQVLHHETAPSLTPSTADAQHLLVPPGWDSWSKIEAIHESFSCAAWHEAWAHDIPAAHAEHTTRLCERVVPAPPPDASAMADDVQVPPEHDFLADLEARQATDNAAPVSTAPARNAMGPSMHTSTLDLPSVGRVLDEQTQPVPREEARAPSLTTPKQTEVLHSFFQSLLKKPSSPSGSSPRTTHRARRHKDSS